MPDYDDAIEKLKKKLAKESIKNEDTKLDI